MRDWGAVKSLLADSVLVEYSIASGSAAPVKQLMSPDKFVDISKMTLPGYLHTQHLVGNLVVTVKGDHAEANSQVWMSHFLPNDEGESYWNVVGTYHHELVRTRTGWKISTMGVSILYEMGNTRLPALAGARVKAGVIMKTP